MPISEERAREMFWQRANMTDNDAMCGLYVKAENRFWHVSVTRVRDSETMFNVLHAGPGLPVKETMDKMTLWQKFSTGEWLHFDDGTKVYVR